MALLSPFFHFPFFSLFYLFCFSGLCQRGISLNFLDIKVNPNSLLFSERERVFSLFYLFCFSGLCQRGISLNFLDIKVNPNSLLFSERERERERERESSKSSRKGGWSGFAMVLGKLLVPGRPTNLDNSRARTNCACSRCGWGLFGHFFSHLVFFLFFLPL